MEEEELARGRPSKDGTLERAEYKYIKTRILSEKHPPAIHRNE